MHIGKKIKLLRQLRGYTQGGLAEKINKTRPLISHIEQTGKVNHYTLLALCKAFNVTTEELENVTENQLIAVDPRARYGKNETDQLKQQLENCRKENEMLKELIAAQKKVIAMMEKKGGKI